MPKKQVIGVVTSDKMNKSRRVEIQRLVRHPKYGKFVRRRTVCLVHDENNDSRVGDKVEIVEAPPRSKLKRWDLVRVVAKSQAVDIAAMRAAAEVELTQMLGDETPAEEQAGDEKTADEQAGDEQAGDEQAGDDKVDQ